MGLLTWFRRKFGKLEEPLPSDNPLPQKQYSNLQVGAVTHQKSTSYVTRPAPRPKTEDDTEEGFSLADLAKMAEPVATEDNPAKAEPTPTFEGFLGGTSGGGGASGTWANAVDPTPADTEEAAAQPTSNEKEKQEEVKSEPEPDAPKDDDKTDQDK